MRVEVCLYFDTEPRAWWNFYTWYGPITRAWLCAIRFLRYFEVYVEIDRGER